MMETSRKTFINSESEVPRMKQKVLWIIATFTLLVIVSTADWRSQSSRQGRDAFVADVQAKAQVDWPAIAFQQVSLPNLASPVYLTHAGDGSGRIFIVERSGRIQLVKNGALQPTPFLDISGRVRSPSSGGGFEEGLLGLAFPPDYAQRQRFYVYYTQPDGDNVVARFHTSANPDLGDPSSEELILEIPHPERTNHNGGQLAFGPDGYLYLGPGDGGGGGDPDNNGQNPATLLGKILRIDVEAKIPTSTPGEPNRIFFPLISRNNGLPYRVPPDNPFIGQSGYLPEIWALGLRNPWRFSFDRSTGNLYIADVGQDDVEEINFQAAGSNGGQNYGWNILEGSQCYPPGSSCTPPANYVAPVAEYLHGANDSNGCSVTGGYVYRGAAYPNLQGIYFYADYCQGKVYGLKFENSAWQSQMLLDTTYRPSSFGEDENGEIYLVDILGQVYRLTGVTAAR
jgi:glucose/arabinose dehydrogenase